MDPLSLNCGPPELIFSFSFMGPTVDSGSRKEINGGPLERERKWKKKEAISWSLQRSIASFFILSLWAHHPTFPWSSIHLLAILSQENIIMPTDAWSHSLVSSSGSTARSFSFFSSVPGGKIRRVETNERECWEFLDWRLASENDSLVPGQPSFLKELLF